MQTTAELVRALVQLRCLDGQPDQALVELQQRLPLLAQHHVALATVQGLWLTAVAGAAAAGDAGLALQASGRGGARCWMVLRRRTAH